MAKKINLSLPTHKEKSKDAWVEQGKASHSPTAVALSHPHPPVEPEKPVMKRLTLDLSADLHARIKMQCAQEGRKMADVLRDILEQHFSQAS